MIQIAMLVINFYKRLAIADDNYSLMNIISEKKPVHEIVDVNDSNAVQNLATEILNQNIDDIRKINKEDDPDIDFSRDDMISFGVETKVDGETLITLNFSFSTKLPRIGCIVVNQKCFDTFVKAKFFLETVERSFSIDYSVIKISDRLLNKVGRKYIAPLGWITYFSNDYEIPIPDDLEGIEYEHTDSGKYLILSKEDIASAPEKLARGKQKLLEIMERIELEYPAYSKRFTPPSAQTAI